MSKKTPPYDGYLDNLIDPIVEDRILAFIDQKWTAKRPPTVAARLLALIVALHARGMPYPPRQHVRAAVGTTSPDGIDDAISLYLGRELISLEIRAVEGNIKKRASSTLEKYYIPSTELVMVATRTGRRFNRAA